MLSWPGLMRSCRMQEDMKADSLNRRQAAQEARAQPPKFRLLWYDEEQAPLEPGTIRIQLKWLDEVRQ